MHETNSAVTLYFTLLGGEEEVNKEYALYTCENAEIKDNPQV